MYVVSYDISNDRRRRKIAKELENYGTRVQYSVFECNLTRTRYGKLFKRLSELMLEEEEGSVRIYEICANCEKKIVTIGIADGKRDFEDEEVVVI